MAFLKADEKVRLSREYGGIFWRTDNGRICLIEKQDSDPRPVYYLDENLTEKSYFTLDFGIYGIADESMVYGAYWWAGQFGVIVDRKSMRNGFRMSKNRIIWFDSTGTPVPSYNDLYSPYSAFAVREESAARVYFFQEFSGNMVRFGSADPDEPANTHQYLPWHTRYGLIRGMDFWEPGEIEEPFDYLVVANDNGLIVWMDVSKWLGPYGATTLEMTEYKKVGCIEAKNISDIALDRTNNVLYVLNNYKELLIYNLEPFANEADDYENTAKTLRLSVGDDDREIDPGEEIEVYGKCYDMWEQFLDREGILVEFVSGSGIGKFYDSETEKYLQRVRKLTNENGVAVALYKADEAVS